jgi:hypothetical protein
MENQRKKAEREAGQSLKMSCEGTAPFLCGFAEMD